MLSGWNRYDYNSYVRLHKIQAIQDKRILVSKSLKETGNEKIFLSFNNRFLELNQVNNDLDCDWSANQLRYNGFAYTTTNAWQSESICYRFVEHVIKTIIRPSFFLDNLMELFEPKTIKILLKHNIGLIVREKKVYAVQKTKKNRWLAVEVIAKNKLGEPVILDEKGAIVEQVSRTKAHQTRVNRRRRFDTKLIAAFTP
jgi:hypothetical protein